MMLSAPGAVDVWKVSPGITVVLAEFTRLRLLGVKQIAQLLISAQSEFIPNLLWE
jgi:hypothetical protein